MVMVHKKTNGQTYVQDVHIFVELYEPFVTMRPIEAEKAIGSVIPRSVTS